MTTMEAPAGQVEFRAARVADVSFPQRTATVVVMPYESPTTIYTGTGQFTEVVTRGAFGTVTQRAGKVKANRDHSWDKLVGRAVALYPDRDEGLVADVRLSKTAAGEETLELCADEVLGVSAGFALLRDPDTGREYPDAEKWETRSLRRLNRLYLDHIAFVPNPAYQDAAVVALRGAQEAPGPDPSRPGTPNLHRLYLDRQEALYAALDARYGLTR